MSNRTLIEIVRGRQIWDAPGRPVIEVDVTLRDGSFGRAAAPAGAVTGPATSPEHGDRRDRLDLRSVLSTVTEDIAPRLQALDATDQALVDRRLSATNGRHHEPQVGAAIRAAVSMAVARAAAAASNQPLFRYVAGDRPLILPLPVIRIAADGARADRRGAIRGVMVVCPGASSIAEALRWTAEIALAAGGLTEAAGTDADRLSPGCATDERMLDTLLAAIERAGYRPVEQAGIALDIAASDIHREGRYRLEAAERELGSGEMIQLLEGWLLRYPILSIEDPLAEDDREGCRVFTSAFGDRLQIVGDALLMSDAERVHRAAALNAVNGLLVKPHQRGTLTETRAAFDAARIAGFDTSVSGSGEVSGDLAVAHLAVGWNAGQMKADGFTRSASMAGWNELLRIEEALGADAAFAGRKALRGRGFFPTEGGSRGEDGRTAGEG